MENRKQDKKELEEYKIVIMGNRPETINSLNKLYVHTDKTEQV